MKADVKRGFDTVAHFRAIKEALAAKMKDMTLTQQKEFMQQVRNKEIEIAVEPKTAIYTRQTDGKL